MDTVVVTRHPALIQYLKEIGLVTDQEPVITGNATPDGVRGKHVIGVLPNHLAALAACLTEIPLKIPAELRGKELTLEQVRQFAGEPTTFKVSVVATPKPAAGGVKWTWNDGQGRRGRQPRCFVVAPTGEVSRFEGRDIPGVVKVLGSDFTKNGKWSNSTFRCISPAGTVQVSWDQDWDTGETFPQDSWEAAYGWLVERAPHASRESFEAVVREKFSQAADKFDANRDAVSQFGVK